MVVIVKIQLRKDKVSMLNLNSLLTPTMIFFTVLIVGFIVGKIKIWSISLDISSVLIIAIFIGFILARCYPVILNTEFENAFAKCSEQGTKLFVAVVGISSGQSITKNSWSKIFLYTGMGALIVFSGFMITELIYLADSSMDRSFLLGILCGAMTSTPGLATVCEMYGVNSVLATVGYSATYLFGVIGVVLYVQLFVKKTGKTKKEMHNINKNEKENLLYISIVAVTGNLIGSIKLPFIDCTLSTTGGILIAGIIFGCIFKNKISKDLSVYRNLGLVMFFVGNGISAGIKLDNAINIKGVAYGAIITFTAVIVGDILAKLIAKQKVANRMCIVAGGMTSTPAIGVLVKKGDMKLDMSIYSFTYLGALLTITIGIRFLKL